MHLEMIIKKAIIPGKAEAPKEDKIKIRKKRENDREIDIGGETGKNLRKNHQVIQGTNMNQKVIQVKKAEKIEIEKEKEIGDTDMM